MVYARSKVLIPLCPGQLNETEKNTVEPIKCISVSYYEIVFQLIPYTGAPLTAGYAIAGFHCTKEESNEEQIIIQTDQQT